jgi:peptidoglycan/xylan/chitin deacetylase (PgdA/CDA1 family)
MKTPGMHRIVLIISSILAVLVGSADRGNAAISPPRVTVVFRYDDYSSRSNTDLEEKILRAFSRNKACCTFSIIPCISAVNYLDTKPQEVIFLTAAKAEIARLAMAAGAMDAAQHGYSHQRQGYTHGWYTEYEGLDYDTQLHKIRQGKVFLEKILGAKIITFVPPYNSYDANTLKVLEKLNFRCLSASVRGQTVPSTSLKILPETCTLPQLREVIGYARKMVDYHPIICVMFHQYNFIGIDDTKEAERINHKTSLDEFNQLLSWITSQEDIRVRSISQLLQENVDLSMERFVKNKYYLQLYHLKPAWWPPHYGFSIPAESAFNLRFKNILFDFNALRIINIIYVCSFYLIILISMLIISCLLTLVAFSLSMIIDKIFKYLSLIMVCSLLFSLIFAAHLEYKKIEILTGGLGVSLGLWLACLRWKKSAAKTGHN